MSAEMLRRAAGLMRERAEAATPGPWHRVGGDVEHYFPAIGEAGVVASAIEAEAAHIASWHPDVALAVADWLEFMSEAHEDGYLRGSHALVVARAYLGESA